MQQRPILFICHSLGGIILKRVRASHHLSIWKARKLADIKQALCAASQSRNVVNEVTAGIMFLGTPHLELVDDERWNNWKWILKTNRKDLPKECLGSSDIVNLADTCRSFTRLNSQIPILSVYEGKDTKLRDALLKTFRGGSNRKVVSLLGFIPYMSRRNY